MKKLIRILPCSILITALLCFASCSSPVSIVPRPLSYTKTQGNYELTENSRIIITAGGKYYEVRQNIAEYLADILRSSTGYSIKIANDTESPAVGDIVLSLNSSGGTADESYTLKIEKKKITVTANEAAGLFRGVQTLRQLFGPDIERKSTVQGKKWNVACTEITDNPAYQYRGLMFDVARHFFPKEVIMRQIDLVSQYKINKIHIHLSDDQGWRIEIKSRLALTEIGSLGAVNGDKGGYYTQDDFKEIVKYAAARYIEVIPEIDMPGHVTAALVSIPELNSDGSAAKPRTDIEVGYSTFQVHSEVTYRFIDDVIKEIAEISPSKYFHIGGDEADATPPDDYDYFIGRVSQIVKKYGKTTIGWMPYERSEGILRDAVVQNWYGNYGSSNIADQKGLFIILSPANAYLDQKYNAGTVLGLQWRGFVNLKRAYDWYPAKIFPKSKLLGIESALWAETIVTGDDMDYMLYPRLIANAEVGWTVEEKRNFDEFKNRLAEQFARLDAMGVKYSKDYD